MKLWEIAAEIASEIVGEISGGACLLDKRVALVALLSLF